MNVTTIYREDAALTDRTLVMKKMGDEIILTLNQKLPAITESILRELVYMNFLNWEGKYILNHLEDVEPRNVEDILDRCRNKERTLTILEGIDGMDIWIQKTLFGYRFYAHYMRGIGMVKQIGSYPANLALNVKIPCMLPGIDYVHKIIIAPQAYEYENFFEKFSLEK